MVALIFGFLSLEHATAYGTIALATIGALALIVNGVVVWFSRDQARATREASEATQHSADATLREAKQIAEQVRIAGEQVQLSESQNQAVQHQVEIAQRTLEAQSIPLLIPAGMESCGFSKVISNDESGAVKIMYPSVYLGVINAGNGAAILDAHLASGSCGGIGPMGVILPPALAAGAAGQIKLTATVGQPIEPRPGDMYKVTVPYRSFGDQKARWELTFTAQYFNAEHWIVMVGEIAEAELS